MTDNDLRKSRHWRCSQCGSSWPLDMAVCGNPACGADLGIYGQVIEPEPEKPTEPEKKPPSPEDEKPKDEQKKEPKREKPDRAAQKREAREEQKRRKAEAKSRRRAERETDFTASELVRIPHKLMLPLLIAIPLLVYIINSVLLYFVNHFFIMLRRVLIVEYSALLVITLVCVIVTVSRPGGERCPQAHASPAPDLWRGCGRDLMVHLWLPGQHDFRDLGLHWHRACALCRLQALAAGGTLRQPGQVHCHGRFDHRADAGRSVRGHTDC